MNIRLELLGISKLLAKEWGASVPDAIIASLLHDIGKSMSTKEILSLCVRNNVTMYDFELFENVNALHEKVSTLIFEEEFKGNDKKRMKLISHAISTHSTGDINMNIIDKIVYISDNLDSKEEGKELFKEIKNGQIRNPDHYVKQITKQKIQRSINKGYEHYNPLLDATMKGEQIER